jgi:hypothetical protein
MPLVIDFLLFQHDALDIYPITYTSTINVTLDWKFFVTFHELVISCDEVESYAIEHCPNLTYFIKSWSSY